MRRLIIIIVAVLGCIFMAWALKGGISTNLPLKIYLSLCVSVGGVLLLAKLLPLKRGKSVGCIEVIDTACISPGKFIQLVLVADRLLVLGITAQSINLLTQIEDKERIEKIRVERRAKGSFFEEFQRFYRKDFKRHIERIQNI